MRFDEARGGVFTDSKKKSIDDGVITFKLEADDDAHDDHGDIHVAGHLEDCVSARIRSAADAIKNVIKKYREGANYERGPSDDVENCEPLREDITDMVVAITNAEAHICRIEKGVATVGGVTRVQRHTPAPITDRSDAAARRDMSVKSSSQTA